LQIPRIQACGLARATADAVGIAPGPAIGPLVGPGMDPGIDPGIDPGTDRSEDRSGGVLRDGKITAVAQGYTPGGICPEIRSLFNNTFVQKRNF